MNFVCFNGSVAAFVIFLPRWCCALVVVCLFLICFVVCVCVPVASLNVFLCFVVCALSCLCNGLWWPCLGRFMMCILYMWFWLWFSWPAESWLFVCL